MDNNIFDIIPDFDMGLVIDPIDIRYRFKDSPVPRVNDILDMVNEPYLIEWANKVGLYQRKNHSIYKDEALAVGTFVHEFIDKNINFRTVPDFNIIANTNIRKQVKNAFSGFLAWWNIITTQKCEVLFSEKEIICKYFGGTLDLLIKINDKIYLVDFKTSKYPSYKHSLQVSAYRYLLKTELGIDVDGGCIILMLNKKTGDFKEVGYYLHIEECKEYLDYCEECFLSLVYMYYNISRVKYTFDNLNMEI